MDFYFGKEEDGVLVEQAIVHVSIDPDFPVLKI
jgi:hypothetical protein